VYLRYNSVLIASWCPYCISLCTYCIIVYLLYHGVLTVSWCTYCIITSWCTYCISLLCTSKYTNRNYRNFCNFCLCTYCIMVYSLYTYCISLCTYCIIVYLLYHGVPIVSLHHGVVLWSGRSRGPSSMPVPNLKRIAVFVQKL